jgi:hypothetical protein
MPNSLSHKNQLIDELPPPHVVRRRLGSLLRETQLMRRLLRLAESAELAEAKFRHEWLIEHILVRDQPGVIGGPKKAFKTSLAINMAISLGSGHAFLGNFRVPTRRRVAVFSGESGTATMQETARRICASKRITLKDCDVLWSFDLPRLSQKEHRLKLGGFLRELEIDVVFIDPLYLCLLAGGKSVSASNLYEIGPLLWDAARTCLDAGATPILVHHATKAAAKRGKAAARRCPGARPWAAGGCGRRCRPAPSTAGTPPCPCCSNCRMSRRDRCPSGRSGGTFNRK